MWCSSSVLLPARAGRDRDDEGPRATLRWADGGGQACARTPSPIMTRGQDRESGCLLLLYFSRTCTRPPRPRLYLTNAFSSRPAFIPHRLRILPLSLNDRSILSTSPCQSFHSTYLPVFVPSLPSHMYSPLSTIVLPGFRSFPLFLPPFFRASVFGARAVGGCAFVHEHARVRGSSVISCGGAQCTGSQDRTQRRRYARERPQVFRCAGGEPQPTYADATRRTAVVACTPPAAAAALTAPHPSQAGTPCCRPAGSAPPHRGAGGSVGSSAMRARARVRCRPWRARGYCARG
ncbi:hypothetical protein DFH09DRAFT_390353 [Mycena vulgaris]|nr:hypothetical protein DFH09DRAFT_390353 [Mycena vulgaris]